MEQVAARIHWPVETVTGHGRLELKDLLEHYMLLGGGEMKWVCFGTARKLSPTSVPSPWRELAVRHGLRWPTSRLPSFKRSCLSCISQPLVEKAGGSKSSPKKTAEPSIITYPICHNSSLSLSVRPSATL